MYQMCAHRTRKQNTVQGETPELGSAEKVPDNDELHNSVTQSSLKKDKTKELPDSQNLQDTTFHLDHDDMEEDP